MTPYELVTNAARLMYHSRVKRLPVVGVKGELVGIVSRSDVLSVYNRPDEEIRSEIIETVILNRLFADPDRFAVTVSKGIVTLEGQPETVARGREIAAEAWHVNGVVSVRDRLTYPEGLLSMHSVSPYPNSALAVWQLALIAVVAISGVAFWLAAVYLAAREPRARDHAAAAHSPAQASAGQAPATAPEPGHRAAA